MSQVSHYSLLSSSVPVMNTTLLHPEDIPLQGAGAPCDLTSSKLSFPHLSRPNHSFDTCQSAECH